MTEHALVPLNALLRQRPVQIVLALTLATRLAIAFAPGLPHYTGDSAGYVDSGVNMFTHASFAMTCDPRCIPTLWRTPGYPVVVGLVVGLLKMPLAAMYALQAVFDTFTTLLVAAVGSVVGGRRVGVVAALVHGLNPFAAVFAAQIMTESIVSLTLMGVAYALCRVGTPAGGASAGRIAWVAAGLLLGFATLIRPVLAPLPALLALAVFDPSRWRDQLRGWLFAAAAFVLIVAPWTVRNWVVTRDGGADDSFKVLGSFSSPFYRRLVTPGLVRWYQTYEEPFVWDRPREPPLVAKYFLPDEKERVADLFARIREAGVAVTPEIDASFDAIAQERIAAHPFRTTVLPPISRSARLWITPRLSSLGIESARLSGVGGRLLFTAATTYNALLALLGFVAGFVMIRRSTVRLLLAVPVFLTAIHSFVMFGNQSRYTVPGLPEMAILATLGAWCIFDRMRRRLRQDEARYEVGTRREYTA